MNLIGFRDFLMPWSCLPPELKEFPCRMGCFTFLEHPDLSEEPWSKLLPSTEWSCDFSSRAGSDPGRTCLLLAPLVLGHVSACSSLFL